MAALKYWLWFHTRDNLSPFKARMLLSQFKEPEMIYLQSRHELEALGSLSQAAITSLCDKSLDEVERIIQYCIKEQISIISVQDAMYPERLREIYHAPLVLFIKGALPDIDDEIAISFVGTRKCSAYGICVTDKIAGELAEAGGLIISGMALGIDTAAHEAALRAGKSTIAVLGCGVDVCYPRQNRRLMNRIIENGAVISEYPPGTKPDGRNFPIRNRIISGLSLGVVIAEAPARSGALITASLAAEQGRDVFAVPGDITNPCSYGTNMLIADGAKLITSGEDVLCEYRAQFAHRIITQDPLEKEYKQMRNNSALDTYLSKYGPKEQALLRAIGFETKQIDDIITESGVSAADALSILMILEVDGVVEQSIGKFFKLKI